MKSISCFALLVVAFVALGAGTPAIADMYEYVDEGGAISFTDDPGKIPRSSRNSSKMRVQDEESENLSETSFKLLNNHIIVPVTITYKGQEVKGQFALDTGASITVVSHNIANQFKILPRDTGMAMLQGVTGVGLSATFIVDSITVGPHRAGNIEVMMTSFGSYDGLLGNDVLGSSRFQIDYSARRIRWQ